MLTFQRHHCETTATGTLLLQAGISLSEPMLFGLGQGLGFIFWNSKAMDFPFIGGRIKPDLLTQNLARHLHLDLKVQETASQTKAWKQVQQLLDKGQVVGLKLDCYHLEYFSNPIHFAGHYVAIYAYDEKEAFVVDTQAQGGEVKTSKALYPWFENSRDIARDFGTTAMLMEKAGTGGALFRNFYRDFLYESHALLKIPTLQEAYQAFVEIAQQWTQVSQCFEHIKTLQDRNILDKASKLLIQLAEQEKKAMTLLSKLKKRP